MYQALYRKYRPQTFDDMVGQRHLLAEGKALRRIIDSGEVPNLIFYGPSGVGKTTLAGIIANQMNVQIRVTSGPAIEKPGDLAALLTSVLDSPDKISQYTAECKRMGIKILPPHVNESFEQFTACDKNIRFGLLAVRNLGSNLINQLVSERENGKYVSMYDFCSRNFSRNFNRRALEGLIKSGAMDGLEDNRRKMLYNIDKVLSVVDETKRFSGEGQLDLFGDSKDDVDFELVHIDEMPKSELLSMEKIATGMYLSGHPMNNYRSFTKSPRFTSIIDVNSKKTGDGKRL